MMTFRKAKFDYHVATFGVAGFVQAFAESGLSAGCGPIERHRRGGARHRSCRFMSCGQAPIARSIPPLSLLRSTASPLSWWVSDPFFDQRTDKLVAWRRRQAVPLYGIRD